MINNHEKNESSWFSWIFEMLVWAEATDVLKDEETVEFELGTNERIIEVEIHEES